MEKLDYYVEAAQLSFDHPNALIKKISKQLLTTKELSIILKVPVKTIEYWRYKFKNMPAKEMGRHVRYVLSDILNWQQKQFGG